MIHTTTVEFDYGNIKYEFECEISVTQTEWGVEYDTMEIVTMKIGGVDVFDLLESATLLGHPRSVGEEILDLAFEQAEKELSEVDYEED